MFGSMGDYRWLTGERLGLIVGVRNSRRLAADGRRVSGREVLSLIRHIEACFVSGTDLLEHEPVPGSFDSFPRVNDF